jgi:hypothetical protein
MIIDQMADSYQKKLARSKARYQEMKTERPEEFEAFRQRQLVATRRWNAAVAEDPVKRAANAERMRSYRARKREELLAAANTNGGCV